jgi:uncharacterized damage-inducible protein DinB
MMDLLAYNAWLAYQLELWNEWARSRDDVAWLALPTGNPTFPTAAAMLAHAFTPLHRYSDQVLGVEAIAPPTLDAGWPPLHAWAQTCLGRHAQACTAVLADPQRVVDFKTRSAGILTATAGIALTHAATHCFWHLGGVAHLLRAAGIAPPQHSDLIFWAGSRRDATAKES